MRPDRAVRGLRRACDDEVKALGVSIADRPETPHVEAIHAVVAQHQRSDGDGIAPVLHDEDVKLLAVAEALPPGPHPFVAEKRVIDSHGGGEITPDGLQIEKRLILRDRFDTDAGSVARCHRDHRARDRRGRDRRTGRRHQTAEVFIASRVTCNSSIPPTQ